MIRILLALFLACPPGDGGEDAVIPEARAPRLYTEPHRVIMGEDGYWLRFPLDFRLDRPAPLLLLLHDRDAGGTDQARATITGPFAAAFHERGWIVAAPAMTKRHRPAWADAGPYLLSILRHLRRTYSVATVLLGGTAAGGGAAMEYGLRHPWEVDGVAALGGGTRARGEADARRLPLYIGVGTLDEKAHAQARSQAAHLRDQDFHDVTFREHPGLGPALGEEAVRDVTAWAAARTETFAQRQTLRAERLRAWLAGCDTPNEWVELGEWCLTHRFEAEAAEAFRRALEANPQSARARHAAGYAKVGGRWILRQELESNPMLQDGREVAKLTPEERRAALAAAGRDLLSPRAETRRAAILALGALGDEATTRLLAPALLVESDPGLLPLLQDALRRHPPRAVAAELRAWVGDPNVTLVQKGLALEVLERLPVEHGLPVILEYYLTDRAARATARGVLAGAGPAAREGLTPLLSDRDPHRVALALDALGELRAPASAPALVRLLGHDDARVQAAARLALLKTGRSAAPALRRALEEPHGPRAREVLREIAGESPPPRR